MEEINIKDFLEYLKRYVLLILAVVAVALVIVVVYEKKFKSARYSASTTIVLTQTNQAQEATITQNDLQINSKLVSTYSEIVKSKLVLQQVINDLNLDYSYKELYRNVSVQNVQNTEILKISVQDKDPNNAAEITNKIAKIFSKEVSKIYELNNVSIIDVAQVPKDVCNNTLKRDMVLVAFGTIFGMIAIVFIIYYFDDTIKLTENLEDEIGMPLVARILKSDVNNGKNSSPVELLVDKYPKSSVSESVKTLRTNLQFSSVDNDYKTLLITSSIPGEGKSFLSANLAISFVQNGKKVLIIDCDMRKGRQHKIFKMPNTKGLSDLLIDDVANYSKYIKKTHIDNLYLMSRGTIPPNPSELLNSKKNKLLIEKLRSKFHIIIFDGVPCNGLPDSIVMSALVDKVLIVSREGMTPRTVLESTKNALEKVNAPIAGIVLNDINKKGSYYSKYYNYYGDNDK